MLNQNVYAQLEYLLSTMSNVEAVAFCMTFASDRFLKVNRTLGRPDDMSREDFTAFAAGSIEIAIETANMVN